MIEWLRNGKYAAWFLTLVRLYVGWTFMSAGWQKLTGPKPFDATGFLQGAIQKAGGEKPIVQGWYGDFLQNVALPNVEWFNVLVPWGELLAGIGLILGTLTTFSALMCLLMNFSFLMAGAISKNPNLILLGFFLLAAGANAGRFGGDRWVLPWLRNRSRAVLGNRQETALGHQQE